MGEQLSVDTDGVAAPVEAMRKIGDDMHDAVRQLQDRLSAAGACWGDDATGRQFLSQYAAPRDQLIDGSSAMGDVFAGVADNVATMAGGLKKTEMTAATHASSLIAQTPAGTELA
jgi:hypothetical protein